MQNNFIRIAIGTGLILLLPLYLTLTGSGVDGEGFHWTIGDFVFAFVLIFGVASLFELARLKAGGNTAYKFAVGLALAGVFLLVWINGAVGIIGDSDINLLYGAVVVTLFLGSIIARLRPKGMSLTLYAAAFVQFMIPVIAFLINQPDFSPGVAGVFILNSFWVALFAGSGLLFREASTAK